jgi:hypothetical protein
MAHTQIFAFNLFFAMMLVSILSIIPGQGFSAELHLSWGGLQIGTYGAIGAFDVILTPMSGLAVIIGIVIAITVTAIAITFRVVETGLDFPQFKLVALIIGVVFVSAITGTEIFLMSSLPLILQFVLIFPTQIMMMYALVIDIGTHGAG